MEDNEIVGLIASVFVILCSIIKSHTMKGNILMRTMNLIGSTIFIVYGVLIHSYSVIATNLTVVGLSIFHLIKLLQKLNSSEKEIDHGINN